MTVDVIKFAFIAGEISPSFYGRSDLEKFDLALALGENFFVDYRGGVSTRPGLEFIDYVWQDDKPTKLVDFKFSSDIANTNVVLLGHFYVRFIQDGAYVLETAKAVQGLTAANPGVLTANAHGFNNGDWVKPVGIGGFPLLSGQTFQVANKTTNNFQLFTPFGTPFSTVGLGAFTSGGTVARVYTVTSPWDSADLATLRHHQLRDVLRFTHKKYKVRNLKRLAADNWTLTLEDFSNTVTPVNAATITDTHDGGGADNGAGFVITAVNENGQESLPSDYYFIDNARDWSTEQSGVSLKWTPVAGAVYYNVYRTRIMDRTALSRTLPLGFLGRARGASFTDPNIIPDFARTPPRQRNPFADNAIERIEVINQGSGYDNDSTITINDPTGTGAVAYLIASKMYGSESASLGGVIVRTQGQNYTNPTAVTANGGSGATFNFIRSPATGNNPAVGAVFQQRQVYAASENQPHVLWGSRPQKFSDFSTSDIIIASDSYEHEIDTDAVSPIRHMIPTRGGLIVMSELGIWLLSGTGTTAISAINANAESQTYKGATLLPPLKIDTDVLYAEGQGGSIQLLSYDDRLKLYSGTDMSVLANHLFGKGQEVRAWAYADEPFKLAWAQREDGQGLSFTILKDQNVYAWMRQTTKGLFHDMISIQEDRRDSVYTVVQRFINGRWTKFVERFAQRAQPGDVFDHVEESMCLDCALMLTPNFGTTTLTIMATEGEGVPVFSSAPYFAAGDVDKVLRAGGGKAIVKTFVNNLQVLVDFIRPVTKVVPQSTPPIPRPVLPGNWTLDAPVTTVGGLWHLEGQSVIQLIDGNVGLPRQVVNGSITLPQAGTRVIVGLPFRAMIQNLPLNVQGAVVEDKRKRVVNLALRVRQTRGLKTGASLSNLYQIKERTTEPWTEATYLQEGMKHVLIEPQWDEQGQVYIVQDDPLPVTVLGYVLNTEIGDDEP